MPNDDEHPITLADWLVPGWADFSRQRWFSCFCGAIGPLLWLSQGHWLLALLLHLLFAIDAVRSKKR